MPASLALISAPRPPLTRRSLPAPPEATQGNDIEKTLTALGVKYTHNNDALIAENTIEGQRVRKLMEVCGLGCAIAQHVRVSDTLRVRTGEEEGCEASKGDPGDRQARAGLAPHPQAPQGPD